MKTIATALSVIVILGIAAWGQTGQSPATGPAATRPATRPADANVVAELIRQLGDGDYKVRDHASQELMEMGLDVLPPLRVKAREKGLDPEVAARINALLQGPRESQPVRQGGADFQVVAPAMWIAPDGNEAIVIRLALKITNHTEQALQFDLCDTVSVHMRDAAGKELSTQVRRDDRTAIPNPLLVGKDQSGGVDRIAKLKRTDTGFSLTGWDGAGRWWWLDGLGAGRYTVSFTYQSTRTAADRLKATIPVGADPFWIGQAVTSELAIEIVDKPSATTQPATKP